MIDLKKSGVVNCGVFFTKFAPQKQSSTAYFFKADTSTIQKLSADFQDKLHKLSIPFEKEDKTKTK